MYAPHSNIRFARGLEYCLDVQTEAGETYCRYTFEEKFTLRKELVDNERTKY